MQIDKTAPPPVYTTVQTWHNGTRYRCLSFETDPAAAVTVQNAPKSHGRALEPSLWLNPPPPPDLNATNPFQYGP